MRILLVLEASGGGAGRHVVDLADGLLARGHDVALIYSPLRAEAWFVREIGALCRLDIHELPMGRSISFGDVAMRRRLQKLVEEMGPFDVMHGHSSKAGALLRLAQGRNKIPVIYTPHAPITMDPELSVLARSVYIVIERILAGLCERIICVSPDESRHLQSLGFADKKLRVVCNGLGPLPETDRNAVRQKMNLDNETVCFGFVGRISHQKAVDRAISAFATVYRQRSNTRLIIVGDGSELDTMKTLAANLGVAQQVIFTGAAIGTELMAAFDVFLLPSRYEGMPYVLLEAAASALPIVMTDVGGAHLVVHDGENGFVLPQVQHELLADRLLLLVKEPELRQTMALKSAEIAATFSLDNMVDGMLSVYTELVSG
jgi:glycosyltransferase involved in cell wall biosynthesis